MPRMRILSASEQETFDKPPLFDHKQRKQFFSFSRALLDIARTLRTPNSQIGFLLLCGYFKATKRFFLPQDFHGRDVEAAAKILSLSTGNFASEDYGKTTRIRHQKSILEFYGFKPFDRKAESALAIEISTMAKTYLKPKLIFDRGVDFLIQKRIQVPSARTLSDVIRAGLQEHKTELIALMGTHLTDKIRHLLDDLFTTSDDQNQYRLTLLKRLSQSTKPSRVKESISDFETLSVLYHQLEGILSALDIGHTGIRYFAGSVMKSEIFQMQRREANDRYIHAADTLHTASDGQKFEVRGESLHAGRSFKYFGQGQGVSAYTFVDERHFLWHSLMISAADRESAYVIDGLMRNDVVKSDIHSTDTHGYTEAIFGLTHLLGFSFAPRIKGIGKQILYLFRPKNRANPDWKITPDKTINADLIRENWNDLLRLVTTIQLKENTASDIFRRLNSYSRQHALYQTLKAFGQIIKSLFILRYIDDVELRQAIEKQLNKVELSNHFTRAVAVGSPREYTQVEKEEQEIAEGCNRLIKNSIICWNYLYLERQLEKITDPEARANMLRTIATHSPMTWAHINMLGEYDFSDEKLKDSVGILPLKSAA